MLTTGPNVSEGYFFHPERFSPRVTRLVLDETKLEEFIRLARDAETESGLKNPVSIIPFERMFLAALFQKVFGEEIGNKLVKVLRDFNRGCFTLHLPTLAGDQDNQLRVVTAVSYLLGKPRLDASGSHYAHFSITDLQKDDPLLLNPYYVVPLHTDGGFSEASTDWLLFLKREEAEVNGGESTLLHLADWEDWRDFLANPLANADYSFQGPMDHRRAVIGARGDTSALKRPVFFEANGSPAIRISYQYCYPNTIKEGAFLKEITRSLGRSKGKLTFELPPGCLYVVNNNFWLHGRERFTPNPALKRDATRVFGSF